MKSVFVALLLLMASSAQASFLCKSQEVNENGKSAFGMHVHEAKVGNSAHIAVWKTGTESSPYQFDCVRESTDYDNGRTSQYTCQKNGDMTLQVFAQHTGAKIAATVEFRTPDQEILSSMNCKTVKD